MDTETCRCGASSAADPHPCHSNAYTCRKPATRRFYNPQLVALAGAQMKYQVTETWACDPCWATFEAKMNEERMKQEDKLKRAGSTTVSGL